MIFNPLAWIGKICCNRGEVKRPITNRCKQRRLSIEVLEDRTTPTLFSWTGTGNDNLWENPDNWDQSGALPTINDNVYIGTGGTIVNQQGAITAHSIMCGANLAIHDSLTVSGYCSLGGQLQVDGTLTLLAGASVYGGAVDLTGQAHLGTGSQLTFAGDSIVHGGQAVIDGAGKAILNGGTLTIDGNESISNLDVSGGVLQGSGALTLTDTLNSFGGSLTLAGTLNIGTTAKWNIQATNTVEVDGWTVNCDGVINWLQGDVNNSDSTVIVTSSGTFNIGSSGNWYDSLGDGLSTISNVGTLVSTGGSSDTPTSITTKFSSTGSVSVQAGALALQGGGSLSGTLGVASDTQFIFGNGSFTVFSLTQQVNLDQGLVVVDANTRWEDPSAVR